MAAAQGLTVDLTLSWIMTSKKQIKQKEGENKQNCSSVQLLST
jgi:hypothetical protein